MKHYLTAEWGRAVARPYFRAFLLVLLALAAGLPLSIDDAEAVHKSWPHFFEAIKPLGAEVEYAG